MFEIIKYLKEFFCKWAHVASTSLSKQNNSKMYKEWTECHSGCNISKDICYLLIRFTGNS